MAASTASLRKTAPLPMPKLAGHTHQSPAPARRQSAHGNHRIDHLPRQRGLRGQPRRHAGADRARARATSSAASPPRPSRASASRSAASCCRASACRCCSTRARPSWRSRPLAGLGLDNPDLEKSVPGGGVIARHRLGVGRARDGQRVRLRHRCRRAAADGHPQATAHPGTRAGEQAALRATGRERGRQPHDLQGRGVHHRRQPVSQPRAHLGGRPAGGDGDARLVDRGRRLPDRACRTTS